MKNEKTDIIKDEIFYKKKKETAPTLCFLKALKLKLSINEAIEIADAAASEYMIQYYEDIFKDINEKTQERFNKFREHYERYPNQSPYCEVLESGSNVLKVRYNRCPLRDVLICEGLGEFAFSFCKSDATFTERLLPGVKLTRECSIVSGDKHCIMRWENIS